MSCISRLCSRLCSVSVGTVAAFSLPGDVYKVEATAQFLALYWGERGDSADLGRIAEFLRQRA